MKIQHHTIAIHFVYTILRSADRLGISRELILRKANLDAALFDGQERRITPIQFSRVMQAMWTLADDEFLGMAAHPVNHGVFTLMAKQTVHYQKLRSVYRHIANFYNLVTDALSLNFVVNNRQAIFSLCLKRPHFDKDFALREFLLLLFHRFPSWLIGQRIPLLRIDLDYPIPAHVAEYRLMYPCKPKFEQTTCRIVFDATWLENEVIRSPKELRDYLRRAPLDWFLRQDYTALYTQRVILALEASDKAESLSMNQVANQLHLTNRTLRRKLEAEGTNFQQIKDDFRRDRAIHLLSNPRMSVSLISRELGFSEPAAFSRAFKLWTGMSPKAYRN